MSTLLEIMMTNAFESISLIRDISLSPSILGIFKSVSTISGHSFLYIDMASSLARAYTVE